MTVQNLQLSDSAYYVVDVSPFLRSLPAFQTFQKAKTLGGYELYWDRRNTRGNPVGRTV